MTLIHSHTWHKIDREEVKRRGLIYYPGFDNLLCTECGNTSLGDPFGKWW